MFKLGQDVSARLDKALNGSIADVIAEVAELRSDRIARDAVSEAIVEIARKRQEALGRREESCCVLIYEVDNNKKNEDAIRKIVKVFEDRGVQVLRRTCDYDTSPDGGPISTQLYVTIPTGTQTHE